MIEPSKQRIQLTHLCLTGAVIVGLCAAVSFAENIDPANDGSQYAYGENVGWLNAEPLGPGAWGVQVDDFELTGWMWGENVGWISLSCQNTLTCGAIEYGVSNDGSGVLSGLAWAENVGWINFSSATAGVTIDPATGDFSGRAWGEDIGWITFASSGANPYKVTTGWRCAPPPAVPSGSPSLRVKPSGGDVLLSWLAATGATAHDIVSGDGATLRSTGGDFTAATQACLDDNRTTTSLLASSAPSLGESSWFLVRGVNCGGSGSHDSGAVSQVGSRDAEIAASGNDCN
jgi:hypothetical protein